MQFTGPTYRRPETVPERCYPAGVVVESTLRVWAISRWRGPVELTHAFLTAGYRYLPRGTPAMFRLDVNRDPTGTVLISILAHFTNPYDAYSLLGQVFWCGCEFIAFTTCNIFTNYDAIFPTPGHMHTLPYHFGDTDDE
jgi:hypothetical protein